MKNYIRFLLILFMFSREILADEKIFLIETGPVMISIEKNGIQDGWTPMILSTDKFECDLWLDGQGRVWPHPMENPNTGPWFTLALISGKPVIEGWGETGKMEADDGKRKRLLFFRVMPIYLTVDSETSRAYLSMMQPGFGIIGWLEANENETDKEIHLPGIRSSTGARLVYRSGQGICIVKEDLDEVLARDTLNAYSEGNMAKEITGER